MQRLVTKRDLWWLFAAPLYLAIGTLRHEASHALAGRWIGLTISDFVWWPTDKGWGYVRFEPTSATVHWWVMLAAPYMCDALLLLVTVVVCSKSRRLPRWAWVNLIAVGILSPIVDTLWNYKGFWKPRNDVANIIRGYGAGWTHFAFAILLAGYVVGLLVLIRRQPPNNALEWAGAPRGVDSPGGAFGAPANERER